VLGVSSIEIGRGHAEHLAPQVKALMANARITSRDIGRISVCTGPGSFTGLRVGLALAKGMALPSNIETVGISALKVWAAMADPEQARRVLAIADVRRGEVFWQIFERGAAIDKPKLGRLEQAQALKFDVAAGNGASALNFGGREFEASARIDPCVLGWLGMETSPSLSPLSPLYHRAPDAKLPGGITPKAAP
jgi:tRNA threonylcarbamoyl adenosine modification protein YeaZ